jgi:parvulin-like peptidyl-prolyl isomerase
LLQQQHVSRAEFDVVLEVNAYLRKIAGPKVDANLSEDAIRRQFNAMYGEKVVVHYIVCNNMSEVADVRRALAMGQTFEDVARLRSRDRRTGATGGELPPFTLADNRFPDEFKQVAFNLKIGEVSDPVQIGRFIYIAKLIDRIPPALARFEDYRDSVKKQLYDETVQAAMKAMRDRLGRMAMESLHVRDPVLARQWADRLSSQHGQIQTDAQIREELDKEHEPETPAPPLAAQPPATRPVTAP